MLNHATQQARIRVPSTAREQDEFAEWMRSRSRAILALDTETTGSDPYAAGFGVRTVQIGDSQDAWVLIVENDARARELAMNSLAAHSAYVAHNSSFDILALERCGYIENVDVLLSKTMDTFILAHLIDPRSAADDLDAIGHSLKSLSQKYVDPEAKDAQEVLKAFFRANKATVSSGWALPDLIENEDYLRYAGLDVIYTSRLLNVLWSLILRCGLTDLVRREHDLLAITTRMSRRGIRIDREYTLGLKADLEDEAEHWSQVAKGYGVANVNATAQVRDGLLATGVDLTARTATGQLSVGKDVLLPLAGLSPTWEEVPGATPHPLAEAVAKAKRANKWRKAYVEAFLAAGEDDRIHPGIKPLAARTGRMSVTAPPLQQLPSHGWTIRRCLIPEPGNVFISSDFAAIEVRVLAALAGVHQLKDAIASGADLHARTADLIWGQGNWDKNKRGQAKAALFLQVYGGGQNKLATNLGIPVQDAKELFAAFHTAYPEVRPFSDGLKRRLSENENVLISPFGRRLPVSQGREYAATNFIIQSSARDIFVDSLMRVCSLPALEDRVALVIHDEILHQAPIEQAQAQADLVSRLMAGEFHGVPISSDSEIGWGGSWGSLYGCPNDLDVRADSMGESVREDSKVA